MPPVGLLAIAALGLVFAYALPSRIREVGSYAVLRTEGRYRPDMRVIRQSAARVEAPAPAAKAHRSAKGLAPAEARKSIKALGGSVMSRPAAPLDRAANVARHEMVAMRRDRARTLARRAAQARRRATIGVLSVFATSVTWGFVASSAWPLWSAVAASTALGGITIAGRRAVKAQRAADVRLVPVAREVAVAATAVSALQRLTVERAAGRPVMPSFEETQAIEVVTRQALAPAAAPAVVPAPSLPETERDPGWSPGMLPIPAYTLKPVAKPRTARPINEADLAAGVQAAERDAARREAALVARAEGRPEAEASTRTLDDILARRRRRTA